jgi:2-methylcitrate dehydratase
MRTTPEMAAFANATMARDLDLNDVYRVNVQTAGHPSDVILPILAIAESSHADGKMMITGIVAAYEMYVPFVERTAIPGQFEFMGIMATLGSAMGAGIVLRLTKKQLATAVSLALIPNIGLGMRRVGQASTYKEAYAGMAGRQGVFAARMAQAGITAPDQPIEGKNGFVKLVMGGVPVEWQPLGGKNREFLVERTVLKEYPAGGTIQLLIKAALALKEKVHLEAIESLDVKVDAAAYNTSARPEHWAPKTRETADHSIPVCMAMALVDGKLTLDSWLQRRFEAADVLDLVGRTRVEEYSEFTKEFPARKHCLIQAKTRNGSTVEVHEIITPDDQKFTDEQVEAKFLDCAGHVLSPVQIQHALNALWHLEELDDVAGVLDNLRI